MTALRWAELVLVLASLADVWTTRAAIHSGWCREVNRLMRWSTRTTSRALWTKGIGLAMSLVCLEFTNPSIAVPIAWGSAVVMTGISLRNLRLVRRIALEFPR